MSKPGSIQKDELCKQMAILLSDPDEVRWTRAVKLLLCDVAFANVPGAEPLKLQDEMLRLCHAWETDHFRESPFLQEVA